MRKPLSWMTASSPTDDRAAGRSNLPRKPRPPDILSGALAAAPELVPRSDVPAGPSYSLARTSASSSPPAAGTLRMHTVSERASGAIRPRPRVSGVRSSDIVFPDPLAECNVDARLPSATVGLEVLDHVP